MAHLYRERLAALHEALEEKATRAEAAEAIRVLIDRVTLVAENGELGIVLRGDLAAMLSFAGSKKPGAVSGAGPQALAVQASLVAGARNPFCYNFWPGMAPAFRYEVENTHQLAA